MDIWTHKANMTGVVVMILSIIKRHRPISSIVPRPRSSVGEGEGGRSKFDKIGMFCDCLEFLIPTYNERTLRIRPMQMMQNIQ